MSQNALRRECLSYIERHGSPQTFFSNQLKLSRTTFCLWLKGEREIAEHRLDHLKRILSVHPEKETIYYDVERLCGSLQYIDLPEDDTVRLVLTIDDLDLFQVDGKREVEFATDEELQSGLSSYFASGGK